MFDLIYLPSDIAGNLVYIIAAWFLLIFIFSSREYKVHAFIISLASIINLSTNNLVADFTYEQDVSISILFDGVTALILTMFLVFDKVAWKLALLLAFAVLCHIMIIYDLTIASSPFSSIFYNWYDELIITVGLLQMGVSYNGMVDAIRRIQVFAFGSGIVTSGYSQSLPTQKTREN
jgi:hypothetical protein